jgi:hypothetical protein
LFDRTDDISATESTTSRRCWHFFLAEALVDAYSEGRKILDTWIIVEINIQPLCVEKLHSVTIGFSSCHHVRTDNELRFCLSVYRHHLLVMLGWFLVIDLSVQPFNM